MHPSTFSKSLLSINITFTILPIIVILSILTTTTNAQTCYWPNRLAVRPDQGHYLPCALSGPCCKENEACLSNGLCVGGHFGLVSSLNRIDPKKRVTGTEDYGGDYEYKAD